MSKFNPYNVNLTLTHLEPDHDESEKIERLRQAFTELGAEKEAHWQTIKYLCHHFNRFFIKLIIFLKF